MLVYQTNSANGIYIMYNSHLSGVSHTLKTQGSPKIMLIKITILFTTLVLSDSLYSSFWAPLFNPRILNYRVDVSFDPNAGKSRRGEYTKNYGLRGEKLIADLGNGRGFDNVDHQIKNDVKFYYTYPGAD